MAIGKKIKRVIAFLAIPLMLLNSVSSYAADLGFNSGKYENLENIEIDNDKLSGLGEVSRPNACLNHYWTGGSCTTPQYCAVCKKKGSTLPHSMLAATCTQPRRCSRSGCSYTEGSARGHHWQEATCTQPQKCTRSGCSATQGTPKGHDWSISATCTQPARCKNGCGSTSGSPLGHSWSDPTCTEPAKCRRSGCGETKGSKLGHNWVSATCTTPGECSRCHTTTAPAMGHSMKDATCTQPRTCRRAGCSYTEGAPLGHDWSISATCTQPARCKNGCGSTSGSALGHMWIREKCTDQAYCARRCGVENLPSGQHVWRVIPSGEGQICDVCGTYEKIHYHRYTEFVACNLPMRCICGLDGGPETKPGHKLTEATCSHPRMCTNSGCPYYEGTPKDHVMLDADCTHPRTCKNCGTPIGSPLGHKEVPFPDGRKYCSRCHNIINPDGSLTPHTHEFVYYSCSSPLRCVCGVFDSTATVPGHSYYPGTNDCKRPNCSQHRHHYTEFVSCTSPRKCLCGKDGNTSTIPGHLYYPGLDKCQRAGCGSHEHRYTEFVSCTSPRKCVCGAQGGSSTVPGHNYYYGTTICKRGSCSSHQHIYDIYISNSHALRCECGDEITVPEPPKEEYLEPTVLEATNIETITAGDPVNTFTGAHEIDFKVISAGGAQNLAIGLSYKSNKSIYGIFGRGFSWNYESYISEENGDIKLFRSTTDYVVYKHVAGTSNYATDAVGSENDELTKKGDGTYQLRKDGRIFIYDAAGRFTEITEKNGSKTYVRYLEDHTELVDGISGQKINLYFNDKKLVERVANSGTAEALFEYDDNDLLVKYTDPDGFVTQYTYDEKGQVLTGTDNDGNVFFADTYDEKGRIVKQKDASGIESFFAYTDNGEAGKTTVFTDRNGNTKTHTFSKEGRLLSLTDEEGNTTFSEYDEGGNCIKKTDALGNSNHMEYDERHNLVKATDALGNVTEFTYDGHDNLVKITYPDGSEVTNSYDTNDRLVSTTDVRGLTTNNTYDENGFLIKTESGDKVSELTYENGMLKTVTDSLGNVTEYTYDANGNRIETKTPDGAVVSQTVSDFGAVKSTTDALGYVKDYTRNCFDKPLIVKDEAGCETKYTYDERQLLSESKDRKGNVTSYTYDNEERLVKTTYPDGTYTENVYDKSGRLVGTVDAEGNRTSVEYDKAGRVVKETDKNGKESTITYDANGNVISRTDRNGNTTSYTYDCMGRVSTVTNAFNGVTEYTYNDAGDLLSVKDPMGNVSSYTYDIYGRKTSETDPNGNVTRFEYDLNGNLIKSIDALNNETTFEYDECNRLVSTKKGEVVIAVEYDLKGQTVATIDPLGHRSETVYDVRGYVSKSIDALGNETSYSYDGNGNLVSVTDANGHTTTYAVNNVNQVTSVTDALELTTSFAYDKNGRRNKSTNPMGGVSTCIFDKTGNTLTLTGPEGATTDFTYDANGNLASRSTVAENSVKYTYNALNLAESFTNGREQTTTYEYDLSGRIVKSVSPESTVTYTYDGNSNVLTVTDASGTISRTYDALNRVTSVTDTKGRTVSYEYDLYGNLKTLTYPDNTSVTYTYDLCGNIKTVTDWEGRVTAYSYDALNREIQAVTTSNKEDFALALSTYGVWESGEYSDKTGDKADHRRRMRYPERLAVDSSEYNVELSEGFKLRICEYNQYDAYMRYFDVKGGEAYRPTDEAESFSITLIKLEGEKSLSPGQWNRLFSRGVNVSLSASRRGNGTTVTKEYDAVGNLVKTTAKKNTNGKVIDEIIYEYDSINRLVSENYTARFFKYDYTYDDLSRVTKRTTTDTYNGKVTDEANFEYDGAGNINAAGHGEHRDYLTYNSSDNRIESFNNIGFGFDNDGNMTGLTIPDGSGFTLDDLAVENGNMSLVYDSHNRFTSGSIQAEGTIPELGLKATAEIGGSFSYDAEDYRVGSSVNAGVYAEIPLDTAIGDISLSPGEEKNGITNDDSVSDNDTVSDNDIVSDNDTVSGNDSVSQNDTETEEENPGENDDANVGDDVIGEDVSEGDLPPVMPEPDTFTDSFENGEITVLSGNVTDEPVSDTQETEESSQDVSENLESEATEVPTDETVISAEEDEKVSQNTTSDAENALLNSLQGNPADGINVGRRGAEDLINRLDERMTVLEYSDSYEYCYDRENKNLLVRYSEDGTIKKYVYGNGLIATSETKESQSPDYSTYLYDIRGSVTLALDESANTISEYRYSTYGNRHVVKGDSSSELGYCAREGVLTEVTGLLYMRARYYYPDLMRFINQDVVTGDISNSNSLNRYTYVEGNPATMIDPFGLCAEKASTTAKLWKWGTDLFKTAFGATMMFVPGMQAFGASLIINGATGLVMDAFDAFGAYIDPKTGAIISDAMQIAGGIACLFNPATAAYGASQIGSGVGGLAGGFIAENLYNGYIGGEHSETAFVIGNSIGNIIGGFAGGKAYEEPKSSHGPKANNDPYELMSKNQIPSTLSEEEIDAANMANLQMSAKKDLKMVNDAAKEIGVDRNEFGDYIHEVKDQLNMKANQNFTYGELLDLARELKEFFGE